MVISAYTNPGNSPSKGKCSTELFNPAQEVSANTEQFWGWRVGENCTHKVRVSTC